MQTDFINCVNSSKPCHMCIEYEGAYIMFKVLFKSVTLSTWKIVILFTIFGTICVDPRFKNIGADAVTSIDECQLTPVIHVLQYPGCIPKPIPSFACMGRCASYLQVSGSKIWQMERSCMCCQESGEREASVSIFCPQAKAGEKKFRKVTTKAPLDCMCRPCTGIEESAIIPQEIAGYIDEGPLSNHFLKSIT